MNARDIIIKQKKKKKTMAGVVADTKYTFKVDMLATKIAIARAVEEVFGVEVAKVNTVSVRGRLRRQGRNQGYTPSWKKAYVTLTPDSKTIEFFEGMM